MMDNTYSTLLTTVLLLMSSTMSPRMAHAALPLPDNMLAVQVIDHSAEVAAATAHSEAREARADALDAGPHEWTFNTLWQQRRVDDAVPGSRARFGEWEAGLTRGWRVWGKAGLDKQIAAQERIAADNALADARHVAAINLLDRWFAWLSASAQYQLAEQVLQQTNEQLHVVTRRVDAGDAARTDLELATATQASANAALLNLQMERENARAVLLRFYPELVVLNTPPILDDPQDARDTPEVWRSRIIERSHEIALARAEQQRDALTASRAQRDRLPDPIIGVRMLNEQAGNEHAVGITFSQPFGGNARRAQAAERSASARASAALALNMEREINAHADNVVRSAWNSQQIWQAQQTALQAAQQQYQRMRRGYELGEKDMTELLTSQRITLDAAQAELHARLTAHYSQARMQIDSHELWAPADHDHGH